MRSYEGIAADIATARNVENRCETTGYDFWQRKGIFIKT